MQKICVARVLSKQIGIVNSAGLWRLPDNDFRNHSLWLATLLDAKVLPHQELEEHSGPFQLVFRISVLRGIFPNIE